MTMIRLMILLIIVVTITITMMEAGGRGRQRHLQPAGVRDGARLGGRQSAPRDPHGQESKVHNLSGPLIIQGRITSWKERAIPTPRCPVSWALDFADGAQGSL